MPVRKLETVDAFVLTDFADVPASGFVRRARKILQSSTWDMARSATYAFAAFGIERGGASAGVNATDDEAEDAVVRFQSELQDDYDAGRLRLLPGRGVTTSAAQNSSFLAATVVAAAESALGSALEGRTVAIESPGGTPPQWLSDALGERGAVVATVEGVQDKPWLVWGADVDLMLVGSKPGAMNHQGAEMVNAKAVVPWGPIPITTKALAVLINRGVTYVPDFISASGPLLEGLESFPDGSAAADQVSGLLTEIAGRSADANEPLFLGSCRKAETFLQSWQDSLPFGRPLAG